MRRYPMPNWAKKLFVSGGTIHVRIKKLQELSVVKGTKLHVDLKQLGYDVIAFIGIYLEKSSLYDSVAKELQKIPEIVRLNYTTGNYSMFAEIACKDINQLRFVLHDELQKIKGIERTETLSRSMKASAAMCRSLKSRPAFGMAVSSARQRRSRGEPADYSNAHVQGIPQTISQ